MDRARRDDPRRVVGFALEDTIDEHLGEPWQIAIFLARVRRRPARLADRRPATRAGARALARGGLSRSGSRRPRARAGGLALGDHDHRRRGFLGLDRDAAARLSFLLLVPTVLGAVLFKGLKDVVLGDLPRGLAGPFVVGVLAALGTGLLAIQWLLGYVRRHTYGAVRRLPARRRRDRRSSADRDGRPLRDLLVERATPQAGVAPRLSLACSGSSMKPDALSCVGERTTDVSTRHQHRYRHSVRAYDGE